MSVANSTPARARKSIAVRVITNDLTKSHAEAIAAFSAALGFGSFDLNWHTADERYEKSREMELAHISVTTYLRFDFSPDFVQRPYLVYLDSDLLVLDDISSPFESVGASQLGVVRDEFCPTVGKSAALPGFVDHFPSFCGSPYFNAGAFWLDTSFMPTVRNAVVEILAGRKRRYIYYNDQDAMNIWLLEQGLGRVMQLPGHLNRFEIARFLEQGAWSKGARGPAPKGPRDASVVHFVGRSKPWLKHCPTTPDVRLYRFQLRETQRLLRKLGIRTICVRDDN